MIEEFGFAQATSLVLIVAVLLLEISREGRRRWADRRSARAKDVEPFLGDCIPPDSGA